MSGSQIHVNIDTNKDVKEAKKILKTVSCLLPFLPFLFSIFILSSFAKEDSSLFTLLYVFAFISDCLKVYFATQVPITNQSFIKIIWLSKHTHDIILILALWCTHLGPFIFTLSAFFVYLFQTLKGIKKNIAPKLGEARDSIQDLCNSILNLKLLHQICAVLQVLLPFYLFFRGLFTLNGACFICFFIVVFGYTLYALLSDPYHQEIYAQIKKLLKDNSSKIEGASKYVDQFIDITSKIPDFARNLYPVPRKIV